MYLYILNGENEGNRINLSPGKYVIGRSPDSDITLPGDKFISGFHAELEFTENKLLILSDHNSKNGTYLLGEVVKKALRVKPGDIFRVGHTFLKVSRRSEERFSGLEEVGDTTPETILVIDLVGSSSIAQAMGDRIASKIKNALLFSLKQNLKKDTVEFLKNTGDGFLIIFRKVKPAINLARNFLTDLKNHKEFGKIHVRIGIHFGETFKLQDGDRRGMAVDMAFRVESAKVDDMHQTVLGVKKDTMPRADRIFITEVVHKMIANDSSIKTRPIGYFDLKGFTGRHKLFEVLY